jgi:P4 family phage/plasmid primase-like protien
VACLTTGGPLAKVHVGKHGDRAGRTYYVHPRDPETGKVYAPVPEELARFVEMAFDERDRVLIRPTESWTETETNKKRSRVHYKGVCYPRARDLARDYRLWADLLREAEAERTNLFFGVCPRVEASHYDRASQVRVVRVLWADLDNCTVEEAQERCKKAGLPPPSIVIRSGHGVHLYWLLEEPYLIDEAGPPPAIRKQFVDQGAGKKKKVRHYVQAADGTKVYEFSADPKTGGDSRQRNPDFPDRLSPKAERIQHVLTGIAAAIGGDHTQDLSRLLRLPCTLNRKDQRNGVEPVPCMLVDCDATRRYPLNVFEPFAERSPKKADAEAVAKVRLPKGKTLTPRRLNTLNDLANACNLAPVTERSERDYHLCCWAVRQGLDPEAVWAEVADVGKFGERGREYFDRTWTNAENDARQQVYYKTCAKFGRNGTASPNGSTSPPNGPHNDTDARQGEGAGAGGNGVAKVNERIDDPHRLARIWLKQEASHSDSHLARYYRQELWRWELHRWQAVPDAEMGARLTRFCKRQLDDDNRAALADHCGDGEPPAVPKVTRQLVTNVMQALAGDVLLPSTVAMPTWLEGEQATRRNLIALANGILDLDALLAGQDTVLLSHTPRWFSPVCLPYEFDPHADCPQWMAFLQRNLAGDTGKSLLLQQWTGYLLTPDTSMQKCMMMVGEGANGKSVVCAVLTALLGLENVSAVPLELFGDKFRLAGTLGKLANIVAEVGELDRIAEGQLKAFITGDVMEFERKFKSPFSAKPTARLVLATNNPPHFSDKSDGIWRRIMPLHLEVQIPAHERIAGMDTVEYWQESGELPGILNWALAGLHSLRHQRQFSVPDESQEYLEQLRTESNPARRFLEEHYRAGDGEIGCAEVYLAYTTWCQDHGHRPLADSGLGKEVKRLFKTNRRRLGQKKQRYWAYCGLTHSDG